jgi:hypothetical protein
MHNVVRCALLLAVLAIGGCRADSDEPPKLPLGHPELSGPGAATGNPAPALAAAAQAALDSGNALYKAKAYAAALVQYRRAATLAPEHEAPLFGIVMVATATNDRALADSAGAVMRTRQGGGEATGSNLLDVHKRALPDSHPPIVPKDSTPRAGAR